MCTHPFCLPDSLSLARARSLSLSLALGGSWNLFVNGRWPNPNSRDKRGWPNPNSREKLGALSTCSRVVPKPSMLDACVCVRAFRCVCHFPVRCPPVAVSGHAFRCVLEAVRRIRRKFNSGISKAMPTPVYLQNANLPKSRKTLNPLFTTDSRSPRCFYPHPLLVRDTPLLIRQKGKD